MIPTLEFESTAIASGSSHELFSLIVDAKERVTRRQEELSRNGDGRSLTPLTPSRSLHNAYYKREDLTITRAYKVRGAFNCMAVRCGEKQRTFIASSTGNHALGVLKASELLRPDGVRIVVPATIAVHKFDRLESEIRRLESLGINASVIKRGVSFDEAKAWTMEASKTTGEYLLDPYEDRFVVAGQGTIGIEIFDQILPILKNNPEILEVVVMSAVGGGGLLSGISTALIHRFDESSDERVRSKRLKFLGLRLADPNSALGDAIRVKQIAPENRQILKNYPLLPLEDAEIEQGLRWIQNDLRVRVEGAAGAAAFPMLNFSNYRPSDQRLVVVIVSGANVL